MIKLDEESYIVGIWFSSSSTTNNDWMACVVADPENKGRFNIYTRSRYGKDDKIFDSDDTKSWYLHKSSEGQDEDYLIDIVNKLQDMSKIAYDELDKVIVKGSVEKLLEMADAHPWLHLKSENIH